MHCGGVQAQAYPNRSIRIVVPLAPGGNVDLIARAVAEPLSKALGQQVIVENRPGAAALVGTQFVAKAAPDGYTLLAYATSGNGSTGHIAAELFSRAAGVKMLHVPYKGNAQSLVDVMAGRVPMMFNQVSTSIQPVASGRLRPLAVTTLTRSISFPSVPTLDEAGLKGFEDSTWNALMAPAGTPPGILARLQQEVAKIVRGGDLQKRFGERGIEMIASSTPGEFSEYIKSETARYVKLAREENIKAD